MQGLHHDSSHYKSHGTFPFHGTKERIKHQRLQQYESRRSIILDYQQILEESSRIIYSRIPHEVDRHNMQQLRSLHRRLTEKLFVFSLPLLVSNALFDISQVWVGLTTVLPCIHNNDKKKMVKDVQFNMYCVSKYLKQNNHNIEQFMNQVDEKKMDKQIQLEMYRLSQLVQQGHDISHDIEQDINQLDEKNMDKQTQLYLYRLSQFFQTWSQKRACIQDFVQQNHADIYHDIEQIMNQLDSILVIYESRFIHLPANMDSQLLSDLLTKDFKNKINI